MKLKHAFDLKMSEKKVNFGEISYKNVFLFIKTIVLPIFELGT